VSLRATIDERLRKFRAWRDRLPHRKWTVRILVGIPLFVLAFGVLVALNVALRAGGLWGDLVFAIAITTVVLWILTRFVKPLVGEEKRFHAFPRALSATVFALIGAPVAYVTWPVGTILLLAPVIAWLVLYLLHKKRKPLRWMPPLWGAAFVGVGLVLLFVLVRTPLSPADRVPRALPAAQLEEAEAEVAEQFRPLLFFDSAEPRYPLDIEDAIAEGRITMCRGAVSGDDCQSLETTSQIDDAFEYLEVADAAVPRRGGDAGSAYYYHVVREGEAVLVDYWWFYSRNPSPVAGEVFCGPGLRTPPFTCQEHSGDWEGVTVVLEPCPAESQTCVDVAGTLLEPEAVRYAQHEHVVPYSWDELEQLWRELPRPTSAALGPVWESSVREAAEAGDPRPLVFVARNSHASYPFACFRSCRQETRDLPEARFDGGQPWTHNPDECDGCVKPLPVTAAGEPALWNAFSGRWGAQRCILAGAYCDLSGAPRGPSHQTRYRDPSGDEG
ncbi:MAG: hypothetical protein ACRDNI_00350, partial [Gaiellaceae bacterium]